MPRISLEAALALDFADANRLYARHVNPGLLALYQLLDTTDLDVERAVGTELFLRDGRVVLDFSTSMGVVAFGHNHPTIVAAERRCHDGQLLDAIKVAPHRLHGVLAHNLAELLPSPLDVSFFAVSGAEAVEGAMKLCERAQGRYRRRFIVMGGSYHGKTHSALSATTSGGFQRGFLRGIPPENLLEVPYGDLAALRDVLQQHGRGVCAILVEPLQGQGVVVPPAGYLPGLVALAKASGVLTIFDEVKVGIGHTGTFCSFQHEDVVPDVVTLSKALGGGKRAISAIVTSQALFQRAYGSRGDASLHTTTFGGLGETCAVAIAALDVLVEDALLARTRTNGEFLRQELESVARRHPGMITEIRGRGLFLGIQFSLAGAYFALDRWPMPTRGPVTTLDSAIIAAVVRELYRSHNILVHFSASDPDVLHVMPPLNVSREHLSRFVAAIDAVLTKGFARIVAGFVQNQVGL